MVIMLTGMKTPVSIWEKYLKSRKIYRKGKYGSLINHTITKRTVDLFKEIKETI